MGSEHEHRHWDAQHQFDRAAALARLAEHPEVMPPNPEPYRAHKREEAWFRLALLAGVAAVGVALPVILHFATGRARLSRHRAR